MYITVEDFLEKDSLGCSVVVNTLDTCGLALREKENLC